MSMPISSACYRRSAPVSASQVGTRQVLFDAESGVSLVLNPTGSLIWQWLGEPATAEALAERLSATYEDLSLDQARIDVADYLRDLMQDGVVRLDDD
jgi:hypothetical protein